jgi:hypothetical protein
MVSLLELTRALAREGEGRPVTVWCSKYWALVSRDHRSMMSGYIEGAERQGARSVYRGNELEVYISKTAVHYFV